MKFYKEKLYLTADCFLLAASAKFINTGTTIIEPVDMVISLIYGEQIFINADIRMFGSLRPIFFTMFDNLK